jgi:MATE family multidrug resistance protein
MAEDRSDPLDMIGNNGRRPSIWSEYLPESISLPPSFIATSPIVREILTKDIAECSSEDEVSPHASDAGSESEETLPAVDDAKLAFHPNGVAFGLGFSVVPLPGVDRPVPNPHEVEESLRAEISLLRDNDIIPSKESETGRRDSVVQRLLRHAFSTKVQDHEEPLFPDTHGDIETTPLLRNESRELTAPGPGTPPAEEVHQYWEEAVASHVIKTTWQREAKTLVQYGAPLILTFLLHYSVTIGSVLTVGRLGMTELAAVNRKFTISHPNRCLLTIYSRNDDG